jgi:hypothetical protein
MQLIGGGAHGPQAAAAIRHIAAQNGVWSLGNFGGVPPKSAMTLFQSGSSDSTSSSSGQQNQDPLQQPHLDVKDYRHVFNSCGVGMVRSSLFTNERKSSSVTN